MEKENIYIEIRDQIFTLYRNIKYLREKNGLTTKQMAQILGMREKKLINVEKCLSIGHIDEKHLRNVCVTFKMSTDELLNENLIEN